MKEAETMTFWKDFDGQLEEVSRCVNHTSKAQLRHRMRLVEMWDPQQGDCILDVGCGQGGSTEVLAAAVGEKGKVLGIDMAGLEYGAPKTIREAHALTKDSPLGDRIEFRLSTDLLDCDVDFPDGHFDMAVFALSSWHMASSDVLSRLFARVRPWAKRLGYAEWDLRPQNVNQIPHVIAALLQVHFRTVWPGSPPGDIYSLVLPEQARAMAEAAGWRILREDTTDISNDLEDGRMWEISHAFWMGEELAESRDPQVSGYAREVLSSELQLLASLCDDTQVEWLMTTGLNPESKEAFKQKRLPVGVKNMSLPTYAFLAE